jgi:microcystin degradation protein MlrC
MHLFTASLGTETNTFSPIPTGARIPYTRLRRPIYPLDNDAWT